MLRLVPFNDSWVQHDKLDLKGIYKRPRYVVNDYDEQVPERDVNGQPVYDITSPLPIRQHNKWAAKGFVFVTLASRADLRSAWEKGTLKDERGQLVNMREFDQHQTGGPWHIKLYLEGQQQHDSVYLQELTAQVQQFGSEAVEAIRKSQNPHFQLPASLRGIAPGGAPAKASNGGVSMTPATTTLETHGSANATVTHSTKSGTSATPTKERPTRAKASVSKKAGDPEPEIVGAFKG